MQVTNKSTQHTAIREGTEERDSDTQTEER